MIASFFVFFFFFCKLSTYNLEVVLTLNVHVSDEIAHTNKMAADNLHCIMWQKNCISTKHLKTDFVLANNTWLQQLVLELVTACI